jgi:hypothetical protein
MGFDRSSTHLAEVLKRNLIAYWFCIDYGVEPDPTILEELEGNE